MEEDGSNSIRRMSTRSRKIAPKMAAALASSDNRTQVHSIQNLLYIQLFIFFCWGMGCVCWECSQDAIN